MADNMAEPNQELEDLLDLNPGELELEQPIASRWKPKVVSQM